MAGTVQGRNGAGRADGSGVSRRTIVVWSSLVAAMTCVGGLLMVVDGGRGPGLDGLKLPPMIAPSAGPSSVEAVFSTRQSLDRERWLSIVVHHSGSPYGSPESISAAHRALNLRGLGYHFVIGNGNGLGDGEIYAGFRWMDQLPGAHAAGDRAEWYNQHSIGICLVGDGNRRGFSGAQLQRLAQLVSALSRELDIPEDRIVLHSDIASTRDPGRYFPAAAFREQVALLR